MLLAAVWLLGAASAVSAPAPRLATVRISGRSPFGGACVAVNPMFMRNSAVEPDIEVDPADPLRVVAAWIQDDGSAIATSTSLDGGRSWSPRFVPGLARCTGGRQVATLDPWLSFGAAGRLYLASGAGHFVPDPNSPTGERGVSETLISRSSDTGLSWSRPAVSSPLNGTYWDKDSVLADPRSSKRAWAFFTARPSLPGAGGGLYVSQTLDGGRRWSAPRLVYHSQVPGASPLNNGAVVSDGRILVVAFDLLNPFAGPRGQMMTLRSTDAGRSWGRAVHLGTISNAFPTAAGPELVPDLFVPNPPMALAHPFVGLGLLPTIAADPRGPLYVAWANLRLHGRSTVELARSTDGGATWRRMHPVTRTRLQPFGPRLAVAQDGTVGITYYEAPRATSRTTWPADVVLAYSRGSASSWRQVRLAGPTNLMTAEHQGGGLDRRIGDYFGLAASGTSFIAAYILAKPQATVPPQNAFVTRIDLR